MKLSHLFNQALEAHQSGRLDDASRFYRLCLLHGPEDPIAWTNFGALLRKQKKFPQAVAAHRRALELRPGLKTAQVNLTNALCDAGRAPEAVEIREKIVADAPNDWKSIQDLAIALRGAQRYEEAVTLINDAEARLGPDDKGTLQRGLARLMLGDYPRGFRDFEARFAGDEVALPDTVPWPRWSGEPLDGKHILILPEQGFGDAILMARFLPALKAHGCTVSMGVKKPLQRLFAELEGLDHLVSGVKKGDSFDYFSPNMSLPHFVGIPPDGPPAAPRLSIPPDSRARAEKIVAPFKDRFRIGIVWTGSLTYRANHRRSTSPESFLGLAQIPGVQLFSLYKGDGHDDFLASGMAGLIVDACGDDRDFADTAALIDQMDLMITTDTAVVHIAASLGKPVWNMLTCEGFWLYGLGDTTPWYPTMRLFRQPESGDWDSVFAAVESELRELLETRS